MDCLKWTQAWRSNFSSRCNAAAEFPVSETSEEPAQLIFQSLFVTREILQLTMIDDTCAFKGKLIEICKILQIKYYPVYKENHKVILNERLHKFLNKVATIQATQILTFQQCKLSTCFELYAWNAAPVDGTTITWLVAAMARDFHFR